MRSAHILAAMPLAAVVGGGLFLAAVPLRRLRAAAFAWCLLALPASSALAYRLWERHVGPESFALWRLELTPDRMAFVLPLAAASPFFILAAREKDWAENKVEVASALGCLAVAAALTATMSDHFFLLAGMCALATWCLVATAVLRGGAAGRILPFMLPLALSDLCLALGILFLHLADPTRGLFVPPSPLRADGAYGAACALMLTAALLRLGVLPAHRWMPRVSRGGRDILAVHVLAVGMTLGAFLLFAVARLFFAWEGVWTWICLGIAAVSALEVSRGLLLAREGAELTGLLCSALGAGLAMTAASGTQASLAALRVGLWAGLPAVALVETGRRAARGGRWLKLAGGASFLGMPPLAGFAWLWLAARALGDGFSGGTSALFLACFPLLLAQSWVMGATSLFAPSQGEALGVEAWVGASGLIAVCLAVGLFPGAMIDLLMREYGLPVQMPFPGWSSLGTAVLILAASAVVILALRDLGSKEAEAPVRHPSRGALPLLAGRRLCGEGRLAAGKVRAALAAGNLLLYAGWTAAMTYLAFR